MSNTGRYSQTSYPHWVEDSDSQPEEANMQSYGQHPQQHQTSQQATQQLGLVPTSHIASFNPEPVWGTLGHLPGYDQDDNLESTGNQEHVASTAMDGHTPPRSYHGSALHLSSDSAQSQMEDAPAVPNMLPRYGSQVFGPNPSAFPATTSGQAFVGHDHWSQTPVIPREVFYQPQVSHLFREEFSSLAPAPRGDLNPAQPQQNEYHHTLHQAQLAPFPTFGACSDTEQSHTGNEMYNHRATLSKSQADVALTDTHDHGYNGQNGFAPVLSSMYSQTDFTSLSQPSDQYQEQSPPDETVQHQQSPSDAPKVTSSKQPSPDIQTDDPSSEHGLPQAGADQGRLPSISSPPTSEKSNKPKLSPRNVKSDNIVVGVQLPPILLGPVVEPTAHAPDYSLNSAMRIFNPLGGNEEVTEDVPTKGTKRTAKEAVDKDDTAQGGSATKKPKYLADERAAEMESEPEVRTKKANRRGRAAKLVEIDSAALPDYRNTVLRFANYDAANLNLQNRLESIKDSFIATGQDKTIPQSDEQIGLVVKGLCGAMKDLTGAKDSDSRAFKSRWMQGAQYPYSDEVIETTCWRIVDLCMKLHREGPSALSIGDPHYLPQIQKSAHLTFEARIKMITILVREWKARNDGLIKGDTLHTVVAAPIEALLSASNNAGANKARADLLKLGKEHRPEGQGRKRKAADEMLEGTPKTQMRKRKQPKKNAGLFDNSAAVVEDSGAQEGMPSGDALKAPSNTEMAHGADGPWS